MTPSSNQFVSMKACTAFIRQIFQTMRVERLASSHEVSISFLTYFAPFFVLASLLTIRNIKLKNRKADNRQRFERQLSSFHIKCNEGIERPKDSLEDELIINGVVIVIVFFES